MNIYINHLNTLRRKFLENIIQFWNCLKEVFQQVFRESTTEYFSLFISEIPPTALIAYYINYQHFNN